MNIDNVVLVRATSTHLPLDGNLIPTYEGKRLVSDEKSEYYFFIRKKMTEELEKQLGRNINPYSADDSKMLDSILKNYSVLTGDYPTTTLSFSLNGLVPDDINNNFSRMKVAVIDPIKNHINADFVAIDVVDTTIKGLSIGYDLKTDISKEEESLMIYIMRRLRKKDSTKNFILLM